MKTDVKQLGALLGIALVVLATGYWLGSRTVAHAPGAASAPMSTVAPDAPRKILYYRNPMGLQDTSPTPKKDPMGMDYVPVYAGGDAASKAVPANQISINTDKVQKLGVRTEAAQLRALDKRVRAAGKIAPDERRQFAISPKFEGYVERLYVNVTGQAVVKGQALFDVYSPELVSAQREYVIAMQGVDTLQSAPEQAKSGMQQLADASLQRLRNWDISEEQIKALTKSNQTRRTVSFRSPVSGIITEKKAVQGMRFMPGEALYQVADLSSVWVIADVFEQDIGAIRQGAKALVRINAYPDKTFEGRVSYVYPTLNAETRTAQVRIDLPNPGMLLKPAMFAQVELPVSGNEKLVTVPNSAVIDSGTRQIVLIQHAEGRFEPREVKLGQRSDNYVVVLEGVQAGEQVVVAANFLIDAESNLKAAVGGFGHAAHGGKPKQDGQAPATTEHTGHDSAGATTVGHQAEGKVESVDAKAGVITLNHGPIASLKWPAMTMEFKIANASLLSTLKPGVSVAVEIVERQPGEWVITRATPEPASTEQMSTPGDPNAGLHSGH